MGNYRIIRKQIYQIDQKLGGLKVFALYSADGELSGFQFRITGIKDGRKESIQVSLPMASVNDILGLRQELENPESSGLKFRAMSSCPNFRLLEIHYIASGQEIHKPWEFRAYSACGGTCVTLSVPVSIRLSTSTLKKLIDKLLTA